MQLYKQRGQSIAESLVLFVVLLSMVLGIAWLGRLGDVAIKTQQASRYVAFQLTRHEQADDSYQDRFYLGQEHQWRDRKNQKIIQAQNLMLSIDRRQRLGDEAQAGGRDAQAKTLRQEWGIEDKGIYKVNVTANPHYSQVSKKGESKTALGTGLNYFDEQVLSIQKQTAILAGNAHQISDLAAHQHTAQSNTAWLNDAQRSYELGQRIQQFAQPVDSGWKRPEPVFDWLNPWAGKLPSHHVHDHPVESADSPRFNLNE